MIGNEKLPAGELRKRFDVQMIGMTVAEPMEFRPPDGVHLLGGNRVIVGPAAEIGIIIDPGVGGQHGHAVIGDQYGAADRIKAEHARTPYCRTCPPYLMVSHWSLAYWVRHFRVRQIAAKDVGRYQGSAMSEGVMPKRGIANRAMIWYWTLMKCLRMTRTSVLLTDVWVRATGERPANQL